MRTLWDKARQYGFVRLSTLEDGTYFCSIKFNTISHVTLEAKSDFNHITPEDALTTAINRAIEIVNSISQPIAELRRLTDGKSTST